MKTYALIALISLGLQSPWLFAQPPHPRPEHGMLGDEGPGGRPSASPMRQWMRQLREQDPVEFERLQRLRWQDPAAFRAEMSQQFQQKALQRLQTERPSVYEAMMSLAPQDRDWMLQKIARPDLPPPPIRERTEHERPGSPLARRSQIKELVDQYRQASTPEEKATVRKLLSDEVEREYDQRLIARRIQLEEAEEKLRLLREWLDRGEQEKASFIREKLSVWLGEGE